MSSNLTVSARPAALPVAKFVTFCRYGPCVLLAMGIPRASVVSPARDPLAATPGRAGMSADEKPVALPTGVTKWDGLP